MTIPLLHLRHQGPVLATLAKTAWQATTRQKSTATPAPPATPGPMFIQNIPPLPQTLIRDYIRHVGGDPAAYKKVVPFHLYPQWGFPIMARTLENVPYNLMKVVNAGCVVTVNHQIPQNVSLRLRAQLQHVDATDKRVIMTQRFITETEKLPEALIVEQTALVVLKRPKTSQKVKKEKERVPENVREIGRFRVAALSGLEFAFMTGDLNPLHWLSPYARAMGQRGAILHGFSSLARSIELMHRNLFAGDILRITQLSVRFTRPLQLPGEAGVYIDHSGNFFTGDAPNGPAYLVGNIKT
ncbi:MaoC/PaaZ C-terminal domain-containing protein [candidate division CSSED10-310 bacterium]|uniref:MaoC/PaaZ C-terminal domain-containing protein n=1 Tax=candidate division CSSED10-310 bacterium TaxID=2855610 RepID=A0ABV6YYY2_UNCC1